LSASEIRGLLPLGGAVSGFRSPLGPDYTRHRRQASIASHAVAKE
jgi:hypothetical protein